MSQAPFMPLAVDAYIADTTHLSLTEHGAYLLLLMATWRNNGKPLPDDPERLARIVHVSKRQWLKKFRPVISQFFDLSENTWRQKRLEKEWAYVAKRAAISRENGARGGRSKSLNCRDRENPAGSFQVTQKASTHTHTHTHTHKERVDTADCNSPPSAGVAASPQDGLQGAPLEVRPLARKFPGNVDFSNTENRQAFARQRIAERIGQDGVRVVMAASDPNAEKHAEAVRTCKRIARELHLSWSPPAKV